MKTCNKCFIEQPESNFRIHPNGYTYNKCKNCYKIERKQNYKFEKYKINSYKRKRYATDLVYKEKAKQEAKNFFYKNREHKREYDRRYGQENLDKINFQSSKKRARKRNAVPGWLTKEHFNQIKEIYYKRRILTIQTGIEHHVDHIVPLANKFVCGLHVPWNLRIITAEENMKKHNNLVL